MGYWPIIEDAYIKERIRRYYKNIPYVSMVYVDVFPTFNGFKILLSLNVVLKNAHKYTNAVTVMLAISSELRRECCDYFLTFRYWS